VPTHKRSPVGSAGAACYSAAKCAFVVVVAKSTRTCYYERVSRLLVRTSFCRSRRGARARARRHAPTAVVAPLLFSNHMYI
jgi:hypothetical protein